MAPEQEERETFEESDDEVIGVWFKRSLLTIAVVGLAVLGTYWWLRKPGEVAPKTEIEKEAPQHIVVDTEAPSVSFTDITRVAGIDFVHVNGAEGDKLLPESMGSGAAFFDYDNDGDQDLLLVNSMYWPGGDSSDRGATSRLYENSGPALFTDITNRVGLNQPMYATGVAIGDFDADGRSDVFLTAVGENRLFRNTPEGFVNVTSEGGVGGDVTDWSTSAAFFDADGDGDLDLFVANYVKWSRAIDMEVDYRLTGVGRAYGPPVNYEGTHSRLYRNEGAGKFTDISRAAGIHVENEATGVPVGKGLGVLPIDVDEDGLLDLFVSNDTVRNFLFHNQGNGRFEEVGELWGLAYGREGEATGAMGVDAGFIRDDETLGFAIGNFANEMTSMYFSQGDPTLYADEAIGEGIGAASRQALSFGVLFFDYDLDGRLDFVQANGHLENQINVVDPSQTYEQAAQLFWNAGASARAGFSLVGENSVGDLARPIVGRGSAYADVDDDGDLDLLLTQTGGRPTLLRNEQALGNHWLRVRLLGTGANLEAIGARIELTALGVTRRRAVMPTKSYQSHSELPVTFGLGSSSNVESLVVIWPDGARQTVPVTSVDRAMVVEYAPD